MSRRLLAASAIALLATLLPFTRPAAQTRVTGVLQGSLVLLPAPGSAANVAPLHVAAMVPAPAPHALAGTRTVDFAGLFASPQLEPPGDLAPPPIRTALDPARERLTVWAPGAQRVELRLEGDSTTSRTVECRRDSADPNEPATCNAGESLPALARLTIYLRLDGSR